MIHPSPRESPRTALVLLAALLPACTSLDDNKTVVRRFLEEVVSTGAVDRVPEFVAPDYVEDGDPSGARGPEAARRHIQGVRSVWSDLTITVGRQIAEGDVVVTELTARGRHTGEWLGMRPTGRLVEFTGVNVDRVVGGRIVRHGGAANMLGPLLAIGAVEPVAGR